MPADAHERRARVMGSDAHVVVVGRDAEALAQRAITRLEDLERRWSRFRPGSELSRLNAHAGEHVVVSPETFELVERAIEGWRSTHGLFDPTVLANVRAAGYDRDFASVPAHAARLVPSGVHGAPGCAGIECDRRLGTVTLPAGVEIDPGGIGKGLAADLVTAELLDAGALAATVSVGGDLRVRTAEPDNAPWDVAIEDPATGDEVLRIGLHDGAVATTSRVRRRWATAAGEMHHIIDPRTGRPSTSRYATVSVIATNGWWAEVVAKAVLVGGLPIDDYERFDAHAVTIDDAGTVACDRTIARVAA